MHTLHTYVIPQVDPLYKRTAAAFDEGGIEGLLLNHLRVKDDRSSLLLDSSTPLQTTEHLVDDVEVDMSDVTSMCILHPTQLLRTYLVNTVVYIYCMFLEMLKSTDFKVVQMCSTFADFTFQEVHV